MYKEMIQKVLGNLAVDPRHIEAFMRVDHPTLDGLSPERFRAEVLIALACVEEAGPRDSESLAMSYGL